MFIINIFPFDNNQFVMWFWCRCVKRKRFPLTVQLQDEFTPLKSNFVEKMEIVCICLVYLLGR